MANAVVAGGLTAAVTVDRLEVVAAGAPSMAWPARVPGACRADAVGAGLTRYVLAVRVGAA